MPDRITKRIVTTFVALLCLSGIGRARAEFITSFQGAMQLGTPAPGWAYLWNDTGPVGNPANYTALVPQTEAPFNYTSDGLSTRPAPPPGAFVRIGYAGTVPGGHPGRGALQSDSEGIERYAISAYSLSRDGVIALLNTELRNVNPNNAGITDGLNLKVFLNDNAIPVISTETAGGTGSTASFDVVLGYLESGSTIYVAVGSKAADHFDGFTLQYDIIAVPEPVALTSFLIAIVIVVTLVRRVDRSDCAR